MRWVLGDIHGMFHPLDAMLNHLATIDSQPQLIFVGDYFNRGPDSPRVIELLLSLHNARFIRGNHDDVLDLICHDIWLGGESNTFEPLAAARWFLNHGLAETIRSYGISAADQHRLNSAADNGLLQAIRAAIPGPHKQFIRKLVLCVDDPDCFVAHAFWPPEEPNDSVHVRSRVGGDAEMRHRVIWERFQPHQVLAQKPWKRHAFFGHTPVSHYPLAMRRADNIPVAGPMITLLDTAIALGATGRLTAVCVEDGRAVQIDRNCCVVA